MLIATPILGTNLFFLAKTLFDFSCYLACLKVVINAIGLSIFNISLISSFNPLKKLEM
jgi:hypothetical protein